MLRLPPAPLASAIAVIVLGGSAHAALTLTPAAASRGFTLSTFAAGFSANSSGVGPQAIAYRMDGKVLVGDFDENTASKIYLLPSHADNQAGPFLYTATYPYGDASSLGQVQVGDTWKYYLSQTNTGRVVEVDEYGDFIQAIVGINRPMAIAPYPPQGANGPLKGHLFVVSDDATGSIWNVDPVAKTKVLFASVPGGGPHGISFSPDGSILYVPLLTSNFIRAYRTSDATVSWESPVVPGGGPGGTSIGLGTLSGYVYVNFNNGQIWEFGIPGPHAGVMNLIASGGTRGDVIASDPNVYSGAGSPSLLLTQTDRILRLGPPGGGFFGPPTSSPYPVSASVPLVGSWGFAVLMLLFLAVAVGVLSRARPVSITAGRR